jgi:hypothetical protein
MSGESFSVEHADLLGWSYSNDTATVTSSAVSFVDAAGVPATVYLESGRAYLRVTDMAANSDPATQQQVNVYLSSTYGADDESVMLDETGNDTGIFDGWVELAYGPPAPDGLLQTGNSGPPRWSYDTITASYGTETDTAQTTGSYTSFIDFNCAETTVFQAGLAVYLRVRDHNANTDSGVAETTGVDVYSQTTGDSEPVVLTETGPDTGVFEGSISSATGASAPDGILQVSLWDVIHAYHNDAHAPTQSEDSADGVVDVAAPTPDPMTFAAAPHATGFDSIAMTATAADDDLSPVEYYFTCVSGGGHDSGWQTSTAYEDTGLSPNTTYAYTVTARDMSPAQNTTAVSSVASTSTNDEVVIIRAEYRISNGELKVDATSSDGGNVTLTLVGYGDMSWKANKNLYEYRQKPAASPPSPITVSSSGGGSASMEVTYN